MGTHQDRRIFYVLKMGIFGWSVEAALCRPFYKSDLVYLGNVGIDIVLYIYIF